MRVFLIGLGALVIVLIAAVLVAPSFVDWNSQKALITKEARKITGRELAIDGDVSLSLVPSPVLVAEGVRLANVDGGSQATMMALDSLRVHVAFMPLLQGRIQVVSISLVEPTILLEVLPDGRRNWDFALAGGETEAAEAGPAERTEEGRGIPDGEDFAVQVDSFAVENGSLVYRDAQSGREHQVDQFDGQIVAETLGGPFAAEGTARYLGIDMAFDVALGRLLQSGATPLNMQLQLPAFDSEVQFSGSLSLNPDPVGFRGRLKGEGENLAALLAALSTTGRQFPAILGNDFSIDMMVSSDLEELTLSESTLRLGATLLTGETKVALGEPIDVAVRLSVPRLDLDRLLADGARMQPTSSGEADEAEEESSGQPETTGVAVATASPETALTLPLDLSGNANLTVDALVYRGQVVRQVRVNLSMADGRLSVNQALALLPGGSDLSITGDVANSETGPRFEGHVEAASDNLRGVLDWLSIDVTRIPADRLRKMNFSSRVTATRRQVDLSDIDLRIDVSRIAGGIVVAVRERLGLGVGLSLDRINLDAYLPAAPRAEQSSASDDAGVGNQGNGEEPDGGAAARASRASLFDTFDANVNLRVGSMRLRGETADDLRLEGTLQNGTLTLRDLRVADLAGSSLRYVGQLSELGASPAIDGTLEMTVADPVRLARTFEIEEETLDRIGPFSLTANLRGKPDNFGFSSKLALLDGRFALSGNLRLPGGPPRFDLALEAAHPDPGRLARTLTGESDLPEGMGAMDLKAQITGSPDALRIEDLAGDLGPLSLSGGFSLSREETGFFPSDIDLSLALQHDNLTAFAQHTGLAEGLAGDLGGIDVKATLRGDGRRVTVGDLSGAIGPTGLAGSLKADIGGVQPRLEAVNLNLHLRHANLARLSRGLGGPALSPELGGLDLTGHLFGDGTGLNLEKLAGTLGESAVSGALRLDLSQTRPKVTADLQTGELPLHLLAADAQEPGGSGGQGNSGQGSLSPRWSREPIDLAALRSFDADLTLRSNALLFEEVRLSDADMKMLLTDGQIELQRLVGGLYQGTIDVSGTADTGAVIDAELRIAARDVQLQPLVGALADFERLSGPASVEAEVKTRGGSEAELVEGMNGDGELSGALTFAVSAEEQLGNIVLGLLGEKVREVRSVAAASNTLFAAFAGGAADLTGTFSIDEGVLRTIDTRLQGREAFALTHATISLPAWQINSRTDVFRQQDTENAYLTAALSGALDEPDVRISGQPLRRSPQRQEQPAGQQSEEPQSEGQPPSGEPIDPKDLLRGLLKGLAE